VECGVLVPCITLRLTYKALRLKLQYLFSRLLVAVESVEDDVAATGVS